MSNQWQNHDTIIIIYLYVYVKNHYSYTQTVFSQIVNKICYFNLTVCCKTSERGGDLEELLFSNYSILSSVREAVERGRV